MPSPPRLSNNALQFIDLSLRAAERAKLQMTEISRRHSQNESQSLRPQRYPFLGTSYDFASCSRWLQETNL